MNDGITFEEACKLTPGGLTAQQLQNCQTQGVENSIYPYIGIAGLVVLTTVVLFLIFRSRNSKKSS